MLDLEEMQAEREKMIDELGDLVVRHASYAIKGGSKGIVRRYATQVAQLLAGSSTMHRLIRHDEESVRTKTQLLNFYRENMLLENAGIPYDGGPMALSSKMSDW